MALPIKNRLSLAWRLLRGETLRPVTAARREVPPITKEEVAEARQFFPMGKFFIYGHARSGTTVLARTIRLHPEVHCNYQAHFFTRPPLLESLVASEEVGEWLARRSNRWNDGKDLSPVVLRAAADFILEREARRLGKHITGDKSPNSLNDGRSVSLMYKVYPDARLIYILRDGRDTVLSHRFQAFIEFPERLSAEDQRIRADFARDPQPYLTGQRSVFTEMGIRRAAEGWLRNLSETGRLGAGLYGDHYLLLRYEDLLERPWEEMQRVWAFLGASPAGEAERQALEAEMGRNPDAEWQKEKANDIASALQKGKQGNWREMFTPRDTEIFIDVTGGALAEWGYPV